MTVYQGKGFHPAVDVRIQVLVDEGPGEGNSAPTTLVFDRFDAERSEQVVEIAGDWEREALDRSAPLGCGST